VKPRLGQDDELQERRELAASLLGKQVVFRHLPPTLMPARVLAVSDDGMVEVEGLAGEFAPDLFMEYP
jgi:hypothetical protein